MGDKASQAADKDALMEYITDGYNVPFGTFTWQQWQQMQANDAAVHPVSTRH